MLWFSRILKLLIVLVLAFIFFLALLFRWDLPAEEVNKKYLTPQSQWLEVEGVNVHLRILGEGEPVFLLHGSFSSLHTWNSWQLEMSPYFTTISLDLPGHGLTGPDKLKRYSTKDYSQLVLKLAEKLNLPRFHLAGNSMGGAVALQIASENPGKVLSLNLIDAAGAPRREIRTLDSLQKPTRGGGAWIFSIASNPVFSKILLKCTPKFLFAMNMKEVYGDKSKVSDEVVTRYYELMRREGNRQATIDRLTSARGSTINFEKLTMPTLIIWGAKDSWIPVSQAKILEKSIPGSSLEIFEEAGHVPMEEFPTETVAHYLSFLGVEVRKNYLQPSKQVAYGN